MPKINQKGVFNILLLFAIVSIATIGIYFNQKNINFKKESSVSAADNFLIKPYLVYPSDKPIYPEYETAIKSYMAELQAWYGKMVGKTFNMEQLKVIKSTENYLTMRCGANPSNDCIQNPAKLEGNLGQFVNKAIHNGEEKWDDQTATLVFAVGAGGYAGGSKISQKSGWAIVGDWVLEPLSGKSNDWGIPCKYSDGWQCSGNTPKGTPAHELGHAFGLDHPPIGSKSIMIEHGLYPNTGFLENELQVLKASPFFTNTQLNLLQLSTPTPVPVIASCPTGTTKEECIGYAANGVNAYCWGANNKYLGGKCSASCAQASKCGLNSPSPTPASTVKSCPSGTVKTECIGYSANNINAYCWGSNNKYLGGVCKSDCADAAKCGASTATPTPKNEQCISGQRKECIGYAGNGINTYCWQGSKYIKGVCNKDCAGWDGCK